VWVTAAVQINELARLGTDDQGQALQRFSELRAIPDKERKKDQQAELSKLSWRFLKTRLLMMVRMQRLWGSVNDLYGAGSGSSFNGVLLPNGIRHPESRFTQKWDLIQLLLISYVAVVIPFRIGFEVEEIVGSLAFFWDVLVDIYFLIDLLINFRLAYYITNDPLRTGELETDKKAIVHHYLRGWFTIDLLSVLPIKYVYIVAQGGTSSVSNVTKTFRLFRLFKMLQVTKIMRILDRQARFADWTVAMASMINFIGIVYTCHLLACFWYMAGNTNELGWVHRILNQKSLTCPICPNIKLANRYAHSLFTVLLMGDTTAVSAAEKSFGIFSYAVIIIIQASLAGIMSQLLRSARVGEDEYIVKLAQLKAWMKARDFDSDKQRQIMIHFTAQNGSSTYFNEHEILNFLPHGIARQISLDMYRLRSIRTPTRIPCID
jgi:hypothetical protein